MSEPDGDTRAVGVPFEAAPAGPARVVAVGREDERGHFGDLRPPRAEAFPSIQVRQEGARVYCRERTDEHGGRNNEVNTHRVQWRGRMRRRGPTVVRWRPNRVPDWSREAGDVTCATNSPP